MPNTRRLVLADDHPLVLAGLYDFLTTGLIYQVVATAINASELVASIEQHRPEIVVTDFSIPSDEQYGDGLSFISYLRRHFPDMHLLVMTNTVVDSLITQSLYKKGVSGVVLKSDDMVQLKLALDVISGGQIYLPSGCKA